MMGRVSGGEGPLERFATSWCLKDKKIKKFRRAGGGGVVWLLPGKH